MAKLYAEIAKMVSTHSRPKAAGACSFGLSDSSSFQHTAARRRLVWPICTANTVQMFQHTAARRRLAVPASFPDKPSAFQHTAARRRLASLSSSFVGLLTVSTHSRPKAAGNAAEECSLWQVVVSTHSRPKAAGTGSIGQVGRRSVSTHSRSKAAGRDGNGDRADC